jgi:two-component system cell cycle response regulator CtrA
MRVLLIEDDSAMARSIELMLRSEGFNVYTTDLGEEGIDLGKLYDYDIIVLDLQLAGHERFEVLKSLRLAKVQTPVLICRQCDRRSEGQSALASAPTTT